MSHLFFLGCFFGKTTRTDADANANAGKMLKQFNVANKPESSHVF